MYDPFEIPDAWGSDPFGYQEPEEGETMSGGVGCKFKGIAKRIAKKRGTSVRAVRSGWAKKAARKKKR